MADSNIISITCKDTGVKACAGVLVTYGSQDTSVYECGTDRYMAAMIMGAPCYFEAVQHENEDEDREDTGRHTAHYIIEREDGKTEEILSSNSVFLKFNPKQENEYNIHAYTSVDPQQYINCLDATIEYIYDDIKTTDDVNSFINFLRNFAKQYTEYVKMDTDQRIAILLCLGFLEYENEFSTKLFDRVLPVGNGTFEEMDVDTIDKGLREDFDEIFEEEPADDGEEIYESEEDFWEASEPKNHRHGEEHKKAKINAIKTGLFLEGVCAAKCGTVEEFESLKSFLEWSKFYAALETLDRKKAEFASYVYIKDGKLKYALSLKQTGCDSVIDFIGFKATQPAVF